MALPQDGQNANGLTKVTEIPTGKELIFIDPTTNEGGIITLEDLTTQILKKLTSQTFALDQGNMTLLAALNQLNSNRLKSIYISKAFSATDEYSYTGVSITIPPKTLAMLQAKATYNRSKPAGIILSDSETSCDVDNIYDETKDKYPTLLRYICDAKSNEITLYVWAKYESPSDNAIIVSGCMFQTE